MNQKALTYIDYLNIYYRLSLPAELQVEKSGLFLALLNKANSIRRNGKIPDTFTLTNHEAQTLSGILNIRTFHRIRKSLTEFQHNNNWLVKYDSPPHSSKCGTYTLNLVYLETFNALSDKLTTQNDSQNDLSTNLSDSLSDKSAIQSDTIIRIEEKRTEEHDFPEIYSEIVKYANKIFGEMFPANFPEDIKLLKEISAYKIANIKKGIDKAHTQNSKMRLSSILKYALPIAKKGGMYDPLDELSAMDRNRELQTKDAISTLKNYKKQLERKMMLSHNARDCINKAIGFFDEYDNERLKESGTDRAYWQNLKEGDINAVSRS